MFNDSPEPSDPPIPSTDDISPLSSPSDVPFPSSLDHQVVAVMGKSFHLSSHAYSHLSQQIPSPLPQSLQVLISFLHSRLTLLHNGLDFVALVERRAETQTLLPLYLPLILQQCSYSSSHRLLVPVNQKALVGRKPQSVSPLTAIEVRFQPLCKAFGKVRSVSFLLDLLFTRHILRINFHHHTHDTRLSFDTHKKVMTEKLIHFFVQPVIAGRVHGRTDSAAQSMRSGESPIPQPPIPNNSPRPPDAHPAFSRTSSPSRAASPLRRLGWGLSRAHSRDEPFIPVDPWEMRLRRFISPVSTPRRGSLDLDVNCGETLASCIPLPVQCSSTRSKFRKLGSMLGPFFTDTLPRQIYLHFLLRLPALYFSRVVRIFEDAEVSKHEIQRMIQACAPEGDFDQLNKDEPGRRTMSPGGTTRAKNEPQRVFLPFPEEWNPPTVSPALARFKHSWEQFVDSLMREWKTLNLVSALLCTSVNSVCIMSRC